MRTDKLTILVAYRGIPQSPGWATGDALIRAFKALGHRAIPYGRYYSEVPPGQDGGDLPGRPMAAVPTEKIDLCVMLECNDKDPQYNELSMLDVPRVYWEFDTAMHWDFTAQWCGAMEFDRVFLANPEFAARAPGAIYLPYAWDDLHAKDIGLDSKVSTGHRGGAAIIGSHFPERDAFATRLGIKVIESYRAEYLDRVDRLMVHVHHYNSGGEQLLVMRYFETLGMGTFLLCPESESVNRHFTPGLHLATYEGLADCKRKLQAALDDGVYRAEVAAAGHGLVMAEHTYKHRAERILEEVKGL